MANGIIPRHNRQINCFFYQKRWYFLYVNESLGYFSLAMPIMMPPSCITQQIFSEAMEMLTEKYSDFKAQFRMPNACLLSPGYDVSEGLAPSELVGILTCCLQAHALLQTSLFLLAIPAITKN